LLLAVDDAHCADQPSLRWLAYLLNWLEGLAILVAVGTRPAPLGTQGELVAGIVADPAVDLPQLRPMGQRSVAVTVSGGMGEQADARDRFGSRDAIGCRRAGLDLWPPLGFVVGC